MKKTILTIGVLCSLYSCSTNQNTNELNELKNNINNLEHELNDCKEIIDSLDLVGTRVKDIERYIR